MTGGQGTTKLETNASKGVTSTQETEAFGRFIGGTGSTGSPFGYHGADGYRGDGDGPAGLDPYQKVGARYYDAIFGRFITRDTDLTQSPYAYCNGDPVNLSDPTGHESALPPTFETTGSTGIFGEIGYGLGDDNNQANTSAATTTVGSATVAADTSTGSLNISQSELTVTFGGLGTGNGQGVDNSAPNLTGTYDVSAGRFDITAGATFSGAPVQFNGGLMYALGHGFSVGYNPSDGLGVQYTLSKF